MQSPLRWEEKAANLEHLATILRDAAPDTDVVILPEMFSTGFSMAAAELAEPSDGPTVQWMHRLARTYDAAVTGSVITSEGGRFFNRLHWVQSDGRHATYDKRHLFSFSGEGDHYTAGTERLVLEYRGWRICPLVCYDLRFPIWSRNGPLDGSDTGDVYDLLIYVANWPKSRRRPWVTLLEARAHENQAYVVGVNRVGEDGNGVPHSGDSGVYSPKGKLLSSFEPDQTAAETVRLDLEALRAFRAKFPAWEDRDSFRLL